jgi:aspartate beta-hydroxylase
VLLQSWIGRGLLQAVETSPPVPSRLALFMQSAEAGAGRGPLRSHFELQRPLELYPGLETREIHDPGLFPWVATLEAAFPVIREEFDRLASGADGSVFSPVYRGQTSTGEWAAAFLWIFGKQIAETCRLCPETTRLLSAIPGVSEFGTTLYSALAPHTQIAPHYGYSNAKLRCQLPIRVPGRCKLKVGEHEIEQREGKCIVFDDSFLHSAWNDSDEARFVLVFDFYHPDLTPEEVRYLARLAQERELAKSYQPQGGERVAWVADPTH